MFFLRERADIIQSEATKSKGDLETYRQALNTFVSGGNPYEETVASYANLESDPGDKGFAYPPFLLYLYAPAHAIHLYLQANLPHYSFTERFYFDLFGLIADAGVGIVLYLTLKRLRLSKLPILVSLIVWFMNPYIYKSHDYYANDIIVVFLTTLALYFSGIKKDQILSGFFLGLASATKTYPVLLFPAMLYLTASQAPEKGLFLKLKASRSFIFTFVLPFVLMSIPFMASLDSFSTYLHGAFLVQSERFVQGRPFLYYISYFYKVEFLRMVPFNVYTFLAGLSGNIVLPCVLGLANRLSFVDRIKARLTIFNASTIILMCFCLFTPVLNRTYLLWLIPSVCISAFDLFRGKKAVFGFLIVTCFWIFYYAYILPWKDGFHIWHP